MALLNTKLSRWFNPNDPEPAVLQAPETKPLNLQQALDTHRRWKERLLKHLNGSSDESLDAELVSSDCQCELGRWLHGPGKQHYKHIPQYQRTLEAHAEFHIAAAEVIKAHQSGDNDLARQTLNGFFQSASNSNRMELVKLFMAADGQYVG